MSRHYHCVVFNDSITINTDHYVQQYENIIQVQYDNFCLPCVNATIVVIVMWQVKLFSNVRQIIC